MLKQFWKYSKAYLTDITLILYILLIGKHIIIDEWIKNTEVPKFEWADLWIILFIASIAALFLQFTPNFSLGQNLQQLNNRTNKTKKNLHSYKLIIFLSIFFTFIAGIHFTQISFSDFFSESGRTGAQRILGALITPNTKILEKAIFAAIETIYMAFMATIIAIPFAFVLSFFAAKNLMNKNFVFQILYNLIRLFLNFTRSIEPIVWAIIFTVWVGIGPFAGMMALVLHSIAALSKLYSEQIETIEDGPIEAIKATGAKPIFVLWYGVVPQIILPYLSFTIYRWDINVRMATVIGLVGGGGIGTMLMQYTGIAKWNEVGLIVIVIAAIVWIMDYASAKIREHIK